METQHPLACQTLHLPYVHLVYTWIYKTLYDGCMFVVRAIIERKILAFVIFGLVGLASSYGITNYGHFNSNNNLNPSTQALKTHQDTDIANVTPLGASSQAAESNVAVPVSSSFPNRASSSKKTITEQGSVPLPSPVQAQQVNSAPIEVPKYIKCTVQIRQSIENAHLVYVNAEESIYQGNLAAALADLQNRGLGFSGQADVVRQQQADAHQARAQIVESNYMQQLALYECA